jgi:hypothetical protein
VATRRANERRAREEKSRDGVWDEELAHEANQTPFAGGFAHAKRGFAQCERQRPRANLLFASDLISPKFSSQSPAFTVANHANTVATHPAKKRNDLLSPQEVGPSSSRAVLFHLCPVTMLLGMAPWMSVYVSTAMVVLHTRCGVQKIKGRY